ncbi:hypothetical protein BX666DRAFT_2031025 [Dichotomocladium elegans]|nr:hypothetical protein BX666DRAFT_2031025 [Dichotomocladium elegans]
MQIPSTQWRNLVFLIALVILGFTVVLLRHRSHTYATAASLQDTPVTESDVDFASNVIPSGAEHDLISEAAPVDLVKGKEEPLITTPCDRVDFNWLSADRKYWDGWASKTMFMKSDGNFTRKNVFGAEGDIVCIVVMLGPIPAKSAIRPEEHLAPADSLVVTAHGTTNQFLIEVEQHQKHTNIYFAAVRFNHADVYTLQTRIEYRSYFWELPASHHYRPYLFISTNKLIISSNAAAEAASTNGLPRCDPLNPDHQRGVWMNKTVYQQLHPLGIYGLFGDAQEDHAVDHRLFVPDGCRPEYIGIGQAAQCLDRKTVHVWADNNVRRNLKAFSSGNRWCNGNENRKVATVAGAANEAACICNDDDEDHAELYPWAVDPSVPLVVNSTWNVDTQIYFHAVTESIHSRDWRRTISEAVETGQGQGKQQQQQSLPAADVVIVGFGNEDIQLRTTTAMQFQKTFADLVRYLAETVYPTQKIIVRTPQPFCCGSIHSTAWTQGRSEAFTKAVRDAYRWNDRVMLWDVHVLGLPDHMCVEQGSIYTTRKAVSVENQQLWNLLCL